MAAIEVLELVGISERSWHDAVENAFDEARKSVRDIEGVDVVRTTAKVRDGKIAEYHSDVKIAFVVEGES